MITTRRISLIAVGVVLAVILGAALTLLSTWSHRTGDQDLVHQINSLCTQAKKAASAPYIVDDCGPITVSELPQFLAVWCGNPGASDLLSPQHVVYLDDLLTKSGRCP